MRRNRIPQYVALCAIAAVAGCATVESPPPAAPQPAAPPVQAAPAAPPKAAPAPVVRGPASNAASLDDYKKHVADHIHKKSTRERADRLPPMLRSVITLTIEVDRDGKPVQVSLFRGNGYTELEQAAMASVRRAAPLPVPPSAVLNGHETVTFRETWLFRPDGMYQIRSVAENQQLVVPSSGVATRKTDKKK
jgi:protein TonB